MARIRSVKPEFWLDRKLARKLSRDERMLYMGLWNQADEHGRALGDPVVVKGAIFPYDDDLTIAVIDGMLDRLDSVGGVVQRYEVDGDPYLFLPKLGNHQRLEPGKSRSKHPEPPLRPKATVVSDQSEQTAEFATVFSDRASTDPVEIDNGSATFESDQQESEVPRTATIFSDESAQDRREKTLLYGTGSMEQGGAAQTRPREIEDPPQPFCDRHPGGTPENCGACAGARKRWLALKLERDEAAEREAAERAKAERRRKHQAAEDRAAAIRACVMCDETGWADGRTCDHDPASAERDRLGMARAKIVICKFCDADGFRADGSECTHRRAEKHPTPPDPERVEDATPNPQPEDSHA